MSTKEQRYFLITHTKHLSEKISQVEKMPCFNLLVYLLLFLSKQFNLKIEKTKILMLFIGIGLLTNDKTVYFSNSNTH